MHQTDLARKEGETSFSESDSPVYSCVFHIGENVGVAFNVTITKNWNLQYIFSSQH